MARQTAAQVEAKNVLWSEQVGKRCREAVFIISLAVALFLLLALFTYHHGDPGWSLSSSAHHIANAGGLVGAWVADVLFYLFGYFAFTFPLLLIYNAWLFLREEGFEWDHQILATRLGGVFSFICAGCALASIENGGLHAFLPYTAGGILGTVVASGLTHVFNPVGSALLLLAVFLTGITLFSGLSWLALLESIGWLALNGFGILWRLVNKVPSVMWRVISSLRERFRREPELEINRTDPIMEFAPKRSKPKPRIVPPTAPIETSTRYQKDRQVPLFDGPVEGTLPSLTLLDRAELKRARGYSDQDLEDMSREVEQRLLDFGIEVQVVAVHPGPVITRFELQLAPGIKASRISNLDKDLARSLSVVSVRIVEVIPGKTVVGLELPNVEREIVRLSEVLSSKRYEQSRSPLSLAIGKDIAGHPVIVDLGRMPHLLVAGTTGSGKSVGLNAMLLSILFKATPAQVRLILIDPKMLEMSMYDDIPHLLVPVVTDMKEASNSLRWCVGEMERRYRLMAALGVRNLSGFNQKVAEAEKAGTPLLNPLAPALPDEEPQPLEHLPFIVVVIDELADMMMVVGKKVEQLIARIAQKARAAGIHLILATQRPSVDVITGLIKSNIPTRMGFQVSSKIDSRTILDQSGAEQLLGHGDMLYLAPGTGMPSRVHGAFVADHEVQAVTNDWRRRGAPQYLEAITEDDQPVNDNGYAAAESSETEDLDALYDEAVYFVTKSRKASISSVQRSFKIGYNRAARLMDEMERTGVVSGMETNGTREVLAPPPAE